jgi:hypothetical protein
MRSILRIAVAVLLLANSFAQAQPARDSAEKPFHISSKGSAFGVQGEFEGTYRITDYSIEVNVSRASIYVSDHCPYKGRRRINYFRFGLGSNYPGKPRSQFAALPEYLYAIMSPRDEYALSDLHFSIPKAVDLDTANYWLMVEIQEDALDLTFDEDSRGYAFVRGCREMFVNNNCASLNKPPTSFK